MERHRFLAYLLERLRPALGSPRAVLDIAPQPQVAAHLKELGGTYVGFDLERSAGLDVVGDMTSMPFPDSTFDIVVCYHVLEHIPNDRAAMLELRRVLAPQGTAFVQVPWRPGRATDEDPGVVEEAERLRRFGQADHVRWYGNDFEPRLVRADLSATRVEPRSLLTAEAMMRAVMVPHEAVWLVRPAIGAPRRVIPVRPGPLDGLEVGHPGP